VGLRLGRLLGVPVADDGGSALSREDLFAGWRLFFERLAAENPVVLLVEDAQYADAGLLEFLDYLIDWVADLPVYVLVLARPELGQARPGFGAGRNRTMLTLDPLDAVSMDALVDALVPGMPVEARAKITGQAQGIALFAVEMVRSLIDRDIVRPVEGVYLLAGRRGHKQPAGAEHSIPLGPRPARPGPAPHQPARRRRRGPRPQRSPHHRKPPALPTAPGPCRRPGTRRTLGTRNMSMSHPARTTPRQARHSRPSMR
jgi:hypothetical protein